MSFKLFVPSIFMKFREWLIVWSRLIVPGNMYINEIINNQWIIKAISTVTELGVAELLVDGEKDITQLSRLTQTNEEALYRVMRALAGSGIFKEKNNRVFANNKYSSPLAENARNSIKYSVLSNTSAILWQAPNIMIDAVKTGKASREEISKKQFFKDLETKEGKKRNDLYNKGMMEKTNMLCQVLFNYYDFSKFNTIADVGGGNGTLLRNILKSSKSSGFVFDLPEVLRNCEYEGNNVVDQRIKNVEGDVLTEIPLECELYILKNVLHAFGDNDCKKIVSNIDKYAPPKSRIILIEMDIEKRNKYQLGKIMDIQLMIGISNAKERTLYEYESLFGNTNFKLKRVIKTITPLNIIEFVKTA